MSEVVTAIAFVWILVWMYMGFNVRFKSPPPWWLWAGTGVISILMIFTL